MKSSAAHRPSFLGSSIGKKILMAVSGFAFFGFIIGHLAGNLQLFLGPDVFNHYAVTLRKFPAALWGARIMILAMAVLHVWAAVKLTMENRAARPVPYGMKNFREASYASRTMAMSGLIVLAFVVFHLAHLTWGWVHPEHASLIDPSGRHDVYSMTVLGFQTPWIAGFYIVAIYLLCLHLSHGLSSMLQTIGVTNERTLPRARAIGAAVAWTIFAGYAAIPASVLAGIVKLPEWVPVR